MIVYLTISLVMVRQRRRMEDDCLPDYFFSSGETKEENGR